MPFLSKAQNRFGHTAAGQKALGGPAAVREWESATDYKNLPETKSGTTSESAPDKPKKNTMGITKARVGASRVGSPRVGSQRVKGGE